MVNDILKILERRFMSDERNPSPILTSEPSPTTTTEAGAPSRGIINRRSFMKKSVFAGAALAGAGLLAKGVPAFAQKASSQSLPDGDIAILRFLAAAELIESDLWIQYAEL